MKDHESHATGFGLYPRDYQDSMNHFKKGSNLIKSNPSSSSVGRELQRNPIQGQEINGE